MRNKHDMYIDYGRSEKRRSHGSRKRPWLVIFLIIIIFVVGVLNFSTVKTKVDSDINQYIVQRLTPKPTVVPTAQPVKTVINDNVEPEATGDNKEVPVTVKGIYVPAKVAASDEINELIEMVDATEINAMVIDVKDDYGRISYAMSGTMAEDIQAVTNTIPDMKALVKKLKEKNIYLIARIVAFKDPYLAKERQDLAIKNKDGSIYLDSNGEGWVNPYNQKVWEYLVEVAKQSAAIGFDEVQFDYIRFSTNKGISDADFGTEADHKSKEEIITEFTKYAYEELNPLGVYVSADVYGAIINSDIDSKLVGQNYTEMSKNLDYICPMIYPSHFGEGNYGIQYPDLEPFKLISKVLTASAAKLNKIPAGEHHAIVRPWLQDFTAAWIEHHLHYGGDELREEIEGVYSVGYEEWLLWNGSCDYSAKGLLEE